MVTSTFRTRQPPQRFGEWVYDEHQSIRDAIRISEACMASTSIIQEPTSYQEAMSLPEAELWLKAMKAEIESLKVNKTWKLVALPTGRRAIKSKWVFKVKYKPSGQIDKYKARLVAKGFSQIAGVDYSDTYSPVIKSDSMRTMFATTAHSNLHTRQFDICTAYLNSPLDEIIFMVQPEGFIDNEYPEFVCLLLRCLYGLKQGARQWNKKFDTFCEKYDFIPSEAYPCVYRSKLDDLTLLGIFVNDGLICSDNPDKLDAIMLHLSTEFKVSQGDGDYYVGFEVIRRKEAGIVFLHQTRYITEVLKRFHMIDCNPVSTPADPHVHLSIQSDDSECNAPISVPYKEAVGCLMFASLFTRPDISYAVHTVAKYAECPRQMHWTAIKRIFRYLKGTADYGLLYKQCACAPVLTGYCDSDYGGDIDTRKSRTGYLFKLNDSLIAWNSQSQKCTAVSTTEAEYIAACAATKEVVWLRRLLGTFGINFTKPTLIRSDNQSAICLVKNPEFHKRTKHVDIQYHFIRGQFQDKVIDLEYIPTGLQTADILTKALPREPFELFCNHLQMVSRSSLPPEDSFLCSGSSSTSSGSTT